MNVRKKREGGRQGEGFRVGRTKKEQEKNWMSGRIVKEKGEKV